MLQREYDVPISIVEAKDNTHSVSHGMQQALGYAGILEVPSAFSLNGDGLTSHNKIPETGTEIESEFPLESFPSPTELWQRYKNFRKIKDNEEELISQPYHLEPSGKGPSH